MTHRSNARHRARAATRADAIVSISVTLFALTFAFPLLIGGGLTSGLDAKATCAANLQRLGVGLHLCEAENNGRVPMADDGAADDLGFYRVLLTWVDLLYDRGYVASTDIQLCPGDPNPGLVELARGVAWCYNSVDTFHEGATYEYGCRGSYAINNVLTYGWLKDRYEDTSRQIYAVDSSWSYVGSLNAMWYMAPEVGVNGANPVTYPNWQPTAEWGRHDADHGANMLFVDGGIRYLTPHVPTSLRELRDSTFDTTSAFTWLPGEKTARYDNDLYAGSVLEWRGRAPALRSSTGYWQTSPDLPDELRLSYVTDNGLWTKLPNAPVERNALRIRGDANGDGRINAFDIDPFVQSLTDPEGFAVDYPGPEWIADVNSDGAVNAFDIDPFVQRLTAP